MSKCLRAFVCVLKWHSIILIFKVFARVCLCVEVAQHYSNCQSVCARLSVCWRGTALFFSFYLSKWFARVCLCVKLTRFYFPRVLPVVIPPRFSIWNFLRWCFINLGYTNPTYLYCTSSRQIDYSNTLVKIYRRQIYEYIFKIQLFSIGFCWIIRDIRLTYYDWSPPTCTR